MHHLMFTYISTLFLTRQNSKILVFQAATLISSGILMWNLRLKVTSPKMTQPYWLMSPSFS